MIRTTGQTAVCRLFWRGLNHTPKNKIPQPTDPALTGKKNADLQTDRQHWQKQVHQPKRGNYNYRLHNTYTVPCKCVSKPVGPYEYPQKEKQELKYVIFPENPNTKTSSPSPPTPIWSKSVYTCPSLNNLLKYMFAQKDQTWAWWENWSNFASVMDKNCQQLKKNTVIQRIRYKDKIKKHTKHVKQN